MISQYRVEVFARGHLIAEHLVDAPDGLTAINQVETNYGEPAEVEYKTVYHEDGAKERILIVSSWHGYSFLARRTETESGQ